MQASVIRQISLDSNVSIFFSSRKVPAQVQGFSAAGGLATLFHWLVLAGLVSIGLGPTLSTATGSLAGALMNYRLQRRLAFRRAGPHGFTIWRYTASCLFAWFCNLALFYLLHTILASPVLFSQVVTTGVVAALNYLIYKRLVFHEPTV
ncbi:GtrA family protein [Halomonas sp. DX6]|uniref:GtrA family protein n=1 Tax=Billgrantia bachuensis TaxID=2717286 RepID=A0ABX0PNX3_9GAMM|nr:GtrA family protein [Halomonas bachuensis]NIC04987.1 GtrA family protein [Halomonas bachuensis]